MLKRLSVMLFAVLFGLASHSAAAQQTPSVFHQALKAMPDLSQGLAQVAVEEKGAFLPSFGNWFDSGNPGWGLDIQRVGDLIFVVWFTYRPDGTPIWYVTVASLDGMTWTGGIDVFSWDTSTIPVPTATATTVGTMSITWTDEDNATISWTLNGEDGGADISFAPFASGPNLSNLTGHYFPFFTPGWGFTLLTQGSITVLTLYFYKDGEPTWAQAVAAAPGFVQVADLLLFFAPGLCPSCLDKSAKGDFTTESLGSTQFNYAPATGVSNVSLFVPVPSNTTTLGANPFDDIGIGTFAVTGTSITSAYQDNFDPEYEALFEFLAGGSKAADVCLPIEYRETLMDDNPAPTGGFNTAYLHLMPMWGGFPTYNDADCTVPRLWEVFGQMVQPVVQASFTNEVEPDSGAVQLRWVARVPEVFGTGDESCDFEQGYNVYAMKRLSFNGQTPEELRIYGTGVTGVGRLVCRDRFEDSFTFSAQVGLPGHDEFLEDSEPWEMFRIMLRIAP